MTRIYVARELVKLDPSEEPGVFDVLAIEGGVFYYSPDVYDNEAEARHAIAKFTADGEPLDGWDTTEHPGIDENGVYQ